ncbi:MAG TPA: YfbM family protein [Blastocatellia bacterium]
MSMVCGLTAVSEEEISELLANPESLLDSSDEESESVESNEAASACVYLDKAWHGIHFLLTGSAWGGEEPLCYLLEGGEMLDYENYPDGPPRVLRPDQIANWANALSTISAEDLRKRFDPKAMMKAEIYPSIWDRDPEEDDTLGYLLGYYEPLRSFLEQAKKENRGAIITCG